jgi:hypothetical protein
VTFNLDLAINVMAHIEEADKYDGWDQSHWGYIEDSDLLSKFFERGDLVLDKETGNIIGTGTCGTAQCLAGWAVSDSNIPLLWESIGDTTFVATYTKEGDTVESKATDLLGITHEMDAEFEESRDFWPESWRENGTGYTFPALFNGYNTKDDLYMFLAHYSGLDEDDLRRRVEGRRQQVAARYERELREWRESQDAPL